MRADRNGLSRDPSRTKRHMLCTQLLSMATKLRFYSQKSAFPSGRKKSIDNPLYIDRRKQSKVRPTDRPTDGLITYHQ